MSERKKRIETLFHAASELRTPEERERFLNEACLGDESLRNQVGALLNAAFTSRELFRAFEQSGRPAGIIPGETPAERPGSLIGRYKLLEKIGEGGMGVVYLAEQEQPVRRKVALKIIKLGMDTRQVVARFEAERQALALMDHPHIAQVLDGGATATGRPNIVMELVQGVPITDFCAANRTSIIDRLKLFIPVCQAIQSAHQKGIIHRDIKPSNVLVTMHNGAPHPMVIDFGVARAINQRLTEKTLFTNYGAMIGTPVYMSPEQAEMSKLDVDTRSDIYSLGVLLYELLTGVPPFPEERLHGLAYGEMQRVIAEEEPKRPSTRLNKKSAVKSWVRDAKSTIDSDLDWIVMKCLEKDRERRYETANGLATDLNRHLSNEPVLARPPSIAYRFRKFVRRNKVQFATAAAIALVLLAASIVSTRQALRATRAEGSAKAEAAKSRKSEQKATEEADNAKAIKEFLLDNLAGACCGDSIELDAASFELTQEFVKKVASRMEGRFTNQPQVEAEIRQALVRGLGSARDYRGIATQAERLLEIQRRILAPDHSNTVSTIMSLANAWYQSGRREEGMRLLTNTINAMRATHLPGTTGALESLGGAYSLLLMEEGRREEALPYLKEAFATARRFDPNGTPAITWASKLANALDEAGQRRESEDLWREYLEICLQDPNLGPTHPQTLDKQFGLGRLLVRERRADEALSVLSSAIASYQMRLGSNNFMTLRAQCWQALALDQKGDTAAVGRIYTDLHPRLIKYTNHLGARYSFAEMADYFVRQRNHTQARAAFEALRTIFESFSPRNGEELKTFAQATAATKGWEAAAKIYREYGDRVTESVSQSRIRATVFLYSGDSDGYRQVVATVLAAASATGAWNEQQDVLNIASLGAMALSPEQITRCETLIQAFGDGIETATDQQQNSGHCALGCILFRLGRLTNSLEQLEIAEKKFSTGNSRALVLFPKSMCLYRLGHANEARATFDEAEAITQGRLVKSLHESERFLTTAERTCLILRREAQALLGVK